MDNKPVIELKNVSIDFAGKTILKDINLKIHEHETIVVIGPSGAGKTVLLKLMAGVYPPTSGQVLVEGEDWKSINSEAKFKLAEKLGMMFQQSALFDTMTAIENIKFPLREHFHYSEEKLETLALEFLDMVNLKDSYYKKPSELSGGMQKRLAVARAIALHPHIIFYDDPTAGQDPIQADQVLTLIDKLRAENNATLIMTTSLMKVARRMGKRILMVVDHSIIEVGNSSSIDTNPEPRVHQFVRGDIQGPIKPI